MSGGDRELDRLEALFEEALGMRPEERDGFLEARVGDEPELLEELRSLLEHAATDPEFLDRLGERVVRPRAGEALQHARHERLAEALKERYRLVRRIGRGGMATVYLADDLRHGRRVAVKVLDPGLTAMPGAERFLAEIRTTAKLQHPHILPLFDSGEAEGLLYYVMPYVEGESLRARLDRERQLPVEVAVAITSAVAEALDYAHRHGVVHRDLKPGNVLLHEGRPFLMDFGIALALERAEGGQRLTRTGRTLGTPLYMSPEQATGQEVGPASDLYSLGCLLHEMLMGEPPHTAPTRQAVLARIISGEVAPLTEQRKSVPPHVDAVARRALEKLPADRFRSGEAVAAALQDPRFRYEPGGGAAAGETGRRGRMPLGRRRLAAAVVAVAVVAVALGWWALGPGAGSLLEGGGPAEAGADPVESLASARHRSLAAPVDAGGMPSIAVLPFRDMSPSGAHAYFGEGIGEEIINALSALPGLRVPARTSAFLLRDRDIVEVAERLGVETVLEGSLRVEADSVRITAQLIDGGTGFHIWSEQYDRPLESIIAIQEEIARQVVERLRVELVGEPAPLLGARTRSPAAYDRYLLGRSEWNARGEGIRGSIQHFQAALRLDPSFALAYSGLADAYVLLFEYNAMSPDEALPLARTAAERALALDSTLAEAHTSLAEVLTAERRWDEAEEAFRRALELNPGYLTAHHWYGWLLTHLARHEEAIEYLRGAKALDPLSAIVRQDLAAAYYHARRFEEALNELETCREAGLCEGERDHGRVLLALGRPQEALTSARSADSGLSWVHRRPAVEVMALAALGREEETRRVLRNYAERPEGWGRSAELPITHLYLAEMHAAVGDVERALDAVERAEALGLATGPVLVREWPPFDPIRDHPRFQAFLDRLDRPRE